MIRALVFTHHYPSTHWPTRAPYSENTYRALARYCELRVVVPVPWWQRTRWPRELVRVQRERQTGLLATLPTFWSVPGAPRFHAHAIALSLRRHVAEIRREFPFDLILAAWAYPDTVAAATLAEELGRPLVTTVLGSDVNETPRDPVLRPQIEWALRRARRVVSVSSALGDRLVELGVARERIVVQHNGVDGEQFTLRDKAELRARLGLPRDRPLVCFIGNLELSKGVDFLIEATAKLVASAPRDVLVALVGGGALEAGLRARVEQLELGKNVRFCGRRLHTEIPDWMGACDVLCLPSRREGCPNVVLEALASGRPVVAARVGGVPELLSADNGVLVTPEDPSALADGIARALEAKWDPIALRKTVPALSWDEVGKTYHGVLSAVLEKARA